MTILFEKLVKNPRDYKIIPRMGYVYIFDKNGDLFYHAEEKYSRSGKLIIYYFDPVRFKCPWITKYTDIPHPVYLYMNRLLKEYDFFRPIHIDDNYVKKFEIRKQMFQAVMTLYSTKPFEYVVKKLLEIYADFPNYTCFCQTVYGKSYIFETMKYGEKSGLKMLDNNFDIKIIFQ